MVWPATVGLRLLDAREIVLVDLERAGCDRLEVERAFFDNRDFHCDLLSSAGHVMCQRDERRFKASLVTCRQVHVAKLRERGRQAPARTNGDEGTISALHPGVESIELLSCLLAQRVASIIDVPRGLSQVTGESRAGVKRSVRNRTRCW